MKLLERQPETAPAPPPEPPVETPPEQAVDPGARTCRSCGAGMEPGQDWCLSCGTAGGRLGERPGLRSATTVLGLTLLLVAGAVAASYAALREDQTVPGQAAPAAQVAQTPPAASATTPPPATTPPVSTTTTPSSGRTTSTRKSTLPKVQVPSGTSSVPIPKATPVPTPPTTTSTPRTSRTPTPTPTPAPATPTPTPPSSGGGTQTTTPKPDTTPATPPPAAIDLGADAASIYDPYGRATATGVAGKALDDDGSTSWYADPPAGATAVDLGFAVNLGQSRGIRAVDITTPTPGFRVEVYASDEATPPPTILDSRWAHITDKSDVGADGKTHIVLGAGTSKYQTLLLWITQPPSDGTRVRISELKVIG